LGLKTNHLATLLARAPEQTKLGKTPEAGFFNGIFFPGGGVKQAPGHVDIVTNILLKTPTTYV
jgi:hypothetical protein